jgi:hypothetical protein
MCRENRNIRVMFNNPPPYHHHHHENRAVYQIMCKNMVEPDRSQMTKRRMRFACWIIKTTNTHSELVTLIAFPRQKWLLEKNSTLLLYIYRLYCSNSHYFIVRRPNRNILKTFFVSRYFIMSMIVYTTVSPAIML